jgi:hypothetical protein
MEAQLRTHPKLKYEGARTWPPALGGGYAPTTIFPVGEQGILREVKLIDRDYIGPRRLELVVDYLGKRRSGQIWIDDTSVVPKLYHILKEHLGEPLSDLGSLVVDL